MKSWKPRCTISCNYFKIRYLQWNQMFTDKSLSSSTTDYTISNRTCLRQTLMNTIYNTYTHLNVFTAGSLAFPHWCVQPPPHRTVSINNALPLLSCELFWPVLLSLVLPIEFPHLLEGVWLKPSLTINTAVSVGLKKIWYLWEALCILCQVLFYPEVPYLSLTVRVGHLWPVLVKDAEIIDINLVSSSLTSLWVWGGVNYKPWW